MKHENAADSITRCLDCPFGRLVPCPGVILRMALASVLSSALGVKVKVQHFDWNLAASRIRGVEIGNPSEFRQPVMARIGALEVQYQVAGNALSSLGCAST